MREFFGVALITAFLFLGQANAADQDAKAKAAQSKAEALEQKTAVQGHEATPAPGQAITKTEAQAVDPAGKEPLDDAITCLARTIYWEARSEDDTAMQAIANVVMNRLAHEGFPKTICAVVKQGKEEGSCQFSWWCDGRSDRAEEEAAYAVTKEIARKVLNGQLGDRTHGAIYFHHQRLRPSWSEEYIRTGKIGAHVFYKPADGKAR